MKTLIVTFLLSALVSIVVTPLVRRLAPKIGSVDLPSGRRVNKKIVPRMGGIAILVGFFAPLIALMLYNNRVSVAFQSDISRVVALMGGSLAIAAIGALDDIKGTRALFKLSIQSLVAIGAFLGGFQIKTITLPFVGGLEMGIFALPITVFWIVGIINAVNLIDGLDGLAAGVSFFVCVVNFTIALISNNILLALFAVALGGALIGFLVFNFNPATIFMGDTGSMLVGYILATTSLIGTKGGTAVALLIPFLAMGVPIFDTLLAIVRRSLSRQPIFSPDKGHIHHKLLDMGLTHKKTVLLLYGLSLLFTSAAIAIYVGRTRWQVGVALLVAAVLVFIMMRAVGIFQLSKLKQQQISGDFDATTRAMMTALPEAIVNIQKAEDTKELIKALELFCSDSDLIFATCTSETDCLLKGWVWEASTGTNSLNRGYISSQYPVKSTTSTLAIMFKFGWNSSDASVNPQIDTLLRLLISVIAKRL